MTANEIEPPTKEETLGDFLKRNGILHFSASEVLTMRRLGVEVDPPRREWWPRIIPTLWLAEMLRSELGCPLVIGNGYRPEPYNARVGGAKNSQHLHFRAVDLDLPMNHRSRALQERFYEVAAGLYLDPAFEALKVGLGLYRPWRGTRIHLDTGFRRRHWKKQYTQPLLETLR